MKVSHKINLSSFVAGLLFAWGLGLAGMTQPGKVIGFLDPSSGWDPSLALVMGGSVILYGLGFRLLTQRSAPVLVGMWSLPKAQDLTPRLFLGSALFGLGWGLAGYCPGPALVSTVTGSPEVLAFVFAMAAGMKGEELLERWATKPDDAAAQGA